MSEKFKFILSIMRGSRRYYAVAATAVIFSTVFAYLIPLIIRFTIDRVIGAQEPEDPIGWFRFLTPTPEQQAWLQTNLWACGAAIVGCALLQGGFDYLRARYAATASETFAYNLRNRLFDHINRLSFQTLNSLETGDLIQRGTSDVQTIRLFLETQLVEVSRIFIMVAAALPVMIILSPSMTVVSTIVLPLVLIGSIYYFLQVKKYYQAMAEAEAGMSTVLQENLTGVRTVQAYCREPHDRKSSIVSTLNIEFECRT